MIYSNDPPFIFVHIPKAAGTSIEEALYQYQDFSVNDEEIHQPLIQYRDFLLPEEYDNHFKFCVVRNPFDMMYSTWKYWTDNSNFTIPFEEWVIWRHEGRMMDGIKYVVDTGDEDKTGHLTISWYMNRTPQSFWFLDEEGRFLADYIIGFEHLQHGFDEVVKHLGLTDTFLPHANMGRHEDDRDYRKYYTERSRKIIEERYWLDLKLFGYDFDTLTPDVSKFGHVKPEKDSLKKYEIVYDGSFYVNHTSLPYGFNGGLRRHGTGEDFEHQLRNFELRKLEKRRNSLQHNLTSIQQNIETLENELLNIGDGIDTLDIETTIISERQKELMFKVKLHKIQKEIQNR